MQRLFLRHCVNILRHYGEAGTHIAPPGITRAAARQSTKVGTSFRRRRESSFAPPP